jgi:hypothetical protein
MEETEVVRGRAHETQASCGGDRSTYASGSSCLLTQGACMPDSVDLGANEWRRLPYRSAGGLGSATNGGGNDIYGTGGARVLGTPPASILALECNLLNLFPTKNYSVC